MNKRATLIFHSLLGLFVSLSIFCSAQAPVATKHARKVDSKNSSSAKPTLDKQGKRWWSHIQVLADDRLEGRLTGSAGYQKAAAYVAERFQEYGLKPRGVAGYMQPVGFEVQKVMEGKSSLVMVRGGKSQPLALGEDALIGARVPAPEKLDAPLVFVGYGLYIPDAQYDDFTGMDLKGKVLVYINGGPSSISGALKSHARAAQEFWKIVEQSGAVGVVSIPNPKSMDIPWSRMSLASSQPGMWLSDSSLQDTKSPKLTVTFNPAHAETLFAGTGHTFAEMLALADSGKPLPRFPMGASLQAKIVSERSHVESPNLVGVYPGTDPTLKDEYVVFSAHLDHLGVGQPINGDKIYNGAMDDGSGIASILEIARALHDSHAKLKRSVLFLAVTAEEKGLLGSRYFVGHPTVPKSAMVANLNIDMFLPLHPLNILSVQGVDESTLGEEMRKVGSQDEIEIQGDLEPDRNLFIRSDQYNFIRAGVPALAFKFGYTKGSPEEKMHKDWLTNRYHAPSDDANQPVDLAAAATFDNVMVQLAEKIANDRDRPHWNEKSFFKRFAK